MGAPRRANRGSFCGRRLFFSEITRDRYGVDSAARDIAAGEELTVDYEGVDGERPEPAYRA